MPDYHFHDTGPGPWYERIIGDNRYTVCAGPATEIEHWRDCRVIHVASSMRGVRWIVAKEERKRRSGRAQPFHEYPAVPVEPHAHATAEEAADCRACSPSSLPRRIEDGGEHA